VVDYVFNCINAVLMQQLTFYFIQSALLPCRRPYGKEELSRLVVVPEQ
jgi:hypothetical protein